MATYELVRVTEEGEGDDFLCYKEHAAWYGPILQDPAEATLEEIAGLCDLGAEDCNAHDFVGVHRLLAVILYRRLGRDTATAVLREIAEHGGLDEMNGICSATDAYGDYGVGGTRNHDWSAQDWRTALGEEKR